MDAKESMRSAALNSSNRNIGIIQLSSDYFQLFINIFSAMDVLD